MKIYMIFDGSEDRDAAWLVDAWDEYTMDANYEGYEEAVKKARTESPSGNIAIIQAEIDDERVLAAFRPTEVPITLTEGNETA